MKKFMSLILLVTLLPITASAWHRHHHHHGSGVSFGFSSGYPVYPAYPAYYAAPVPVYQPPVYVERQMIVEEEVQPYNNYARPSSATRYDQGYCREFTRSVKINGRNEQAYGTSCQQPDGSWQIVN